jgi:hypothetical protein
VSFFSSLERSLRPSKAFGHDSPITKFIGNVHATNIALSRFKSPATLVRLSPGGKREKNIAKIIGTIVAIYSTGGAAADALGAGGDTALTAGEVSAAASDAGTLYAPSAVVAGGDAAESLGLTSAAASGTDYAAANAALTAAPTAAPAAGAGLTVGAVAKTGLEVIAAAATTKIAIDSLTGKRRALGTGEQAPPGWQVIDVPAGQAAPDAAAAQGLFGPAQAPSSALLLLLAGAVVVILMR